MTKPASTTHIVADADRILLRSSTAVEDTVQQCSVWTLTGRRFGRVVLPRGMTLRLVARDRAFVGTRERVTGAPVAVVYENSRAPEPEVGSSVGLFSALHRETG